MRTKATILAGMLLAVGMPAATGGEPGGVDLAQLKAIRISEQANDAPAAAAKAIQARLQDHYGLDVPIHKGGYQPDESVILVGRELAVRSGLITKSELDAVAFDGHVIKARDGRIALAAYRPRCTAYAATVLLRHMGVRSYSGGRDLPPGQTFTPLPDKTLPPVALSDQPFFEYRAIVAYLGGKLYGESFGDLGNPQEGANPDILGRQAREDWLPGEWLGGDHTAPYLVPKQLYYDEHPEYFAMKGGKRLPKTTVMQRMNLCLTNPAVARIAGRRMVEWMDIQDDRRFFYCSDADDGPCRCPTCVRSDYVPYYSTDRYLAWANHVARTAAEKHPDNRLFSLAYGATVKPPVKQDLASNIIALYCPWYWNSRSNAVDTFSNPGNLIAMEELSSWLRRFPDQVGIYDYPGGRAYLWLRGMEKRTKWYARKGLRTIYTCGRPSMFGGLFHHVTARLAWNPFLDSRDLETEYVRALYGKAAEPILELVRRNNRNWEDFVAAPTYPKEVPAFMARLTSLEPLFHRAERLAADDEPMVRRRIWKNALSLLETLLPLTKPDGCETMTAKERATFRDRVLWYIRMNRSAVEAYQRDGQRWMVSAREAALKKLLTRLAIDPETLFGSAPEADDDKKAADKAPILSTRPIVDREAIVAGLRVLPEGPPAANKSVTVLAGGGPEDTMGWKTSCTAENVKAPAALAPVAPPLARLAKPQAGVAVTLPMTQLPTRPLPIHPDGRTPLHSGWFVLQKDLPEPVDASGCRYVEFDLDASCALPVSITLRMDGAGEVRTDVSLHPGRQVARLDLRQHAAGGWPEDTWTGRITGVTFVFWPQDNIWPHPKVQDARVALLGITARNYDPAPGELPFAGRAVYLAQHRPNIPHNIPAALRPDGNPQGASGRNERFRTWTRQRVMTPLVAILTGPKPSATLRRAARAAQAYLQKMTGVTLPINPDGLAAGPDAGNVILLGRDAALKAGAATAEELQHVGPEGFVLRAKDGRVAIAGPTDAGALYGLARYLEDHGVRFFEPDRRERVPRNRDTFLHELVDFDRPFFAGRGLPGGWKLRCTGAETGAMPDAAGRADRASVIALANAIKDAARGRADLRANMRDRATASPLHLYVATRLLWDPFQDPSRMIEEYRAGMRKTSP